jgi:hypothetical protein
MDVSKLTEGGVSPFPEIFYGRGNCAAATNLAAMVFDLFSDFTIAMQPVERSTQGVDYIRSFVRSRAVSGECRGA